MDDVNQLMRVDKLCLICASTNVPMNFNETSYVLKISFSNEKQCLRDDEWHRWMKTNERAEPNQNL